MNRKLVIGDIHGGLRALHQIIERAKVTPQDTLIFLGDYVDGWSDGSKLIDYLISLKKQHKFIFLRGNHDELLLYWLTNQHDKIDNKMWMHHGGESTVLDYSNISEEKKRKHILFLQELENYYIDDENRLFVHAGFTNMYGAKAEYFPKLLYWDRTLWETALALDTSITKESNKYPKRFNNYKEIYIGHTPVTRIGETTPINKANVWNIDTGAAFKGPLTILDVETKEYWQSEPVFELYIDEKGRN
jgi:serine/threonine protein phosphatase 1